MTSSRALILGSLALMALICPGCIDVPLVPQEQYRIRAAQFQIRSFMHALHRYKTDIGDFPAEDRGLGGLVNDAGSAGWRGPYVRSLPKDLWGHDYVYRFPKSDAEPEVLSYGADGAPGGEGPNADISSKNLPADLPDPDRAGAGQTYSGDEQLSAVAHRNYCSSLAASVIFVPYSLNTGQPDLAACSKHRPESEEQSLRAAFHHTPVTCRPERRGTDWQA